MRGWRDADSLSPILSRVMPGDLFLQKNVFFSPDLLESVLEDKNSTEKKTIKLLIKMIRTSLFFPFLKTVKFPQKTSRLQIFTIFFPDI